MRKILSLLLTQICICLNAQVDTIYYDISWNKVEVKEFASYFRVVPLSISNSKPNNFRDYYITGELRADGHFVELNVQSASKTKYDGVVLHYYRNGKLMTKTTYKDGLLDGEDIGYSENGLMTHHAYFIDGKIDGIYTEFSSDGKKCTQMEFFQGELKNNYKVVSDEKGYCSIVDLESQKPIYVSPTLKERRTELLDGVKWLYYNKNGIMAGMTEERVSDYGKYYKIKIIIKNNSLHSFDFEPTKTVAVLIDKNKQKKDLHVYPVGEYINKVKNRQKISYAITSLAEAVSAYYAGQSSSTTQTTISGNSTSKGTVYAYGSGGYAYGGYSSSTDFNGTITSSTTSYNGLAAYQARVIASQRLAQYKESLVSECNAKEEGYIKSTTIHPGESLYGYLNVEGKSGLGLIITLKIGGADYVYKWNVSGEYYSY